jgi:hypothetical protein
MAAAAGVSSIHGTSLRCARTLPIPFCTATADAARVASCSFYRRALLGLMVASRAVLSAMRSSAHTTVVTRGGAVALVLWLELPETSPQLALGPIGLVYPLCFMFGAIR